MQKLLQLFVTVIAFAVASISIASEPQKVDVPTMCLSEQDLSQFMGKFPDEKPIIMGYSERRLEDNKVRKFPIVIFVDPKGGTYTAVEQVNNEYFCIMSMGTGKLYMDSFNVF